MIDKFLKSTSVISYTAKEFDKKSFEDISEINLTQQENPIQWVNTYGLKYPKEFRTIINNNNIDIFLLKLLSDDEHPNKVIQLEKLLFVTVKVLKTEAAGLEFEQMMFISSSHLLWSIQEKPGDHFGWIRERLENNKGIVRKKKADYLLFLILESIIDNYQTNYEKFTEDSSNELDISSIKSTPEFTALIEKKKQNLFKFKKASVSLRDTIVKLEKIEINGMNTMYFNEVKEQVNNLLNDIDFEFQNLESKINLIFSIQGHRLNEVMKTLTIFSVIFIPLTFMAGIYGMNFENMPELKSEYGYFILLGVMVLITILSVWYFSKKKWF